MSLLKNKKVTTLFIFGLFALLVTVATILLATRPDTQPRTQPINQETESNQFVIKKACDILTLEDAKKLFDTDNATITPEDNTKQESGDIGVSSCTYIDKSMKTATILVRSAKTPAGQASNSEQFTQKRPINTQDVTGYGERAYWNIQLAQLNILKGNTWYILSYGPPSISQRTLGETDKLAQVITRKLDYAPSENY